MTPFAHETRFRSLLAPLDGSRLAEATIPVARSLAAQLDARLTLLHVLEHAPPPTIHGEAHLTDATAAANYLAGLLPRFAATDGAVQTHVHPNPEHDVAQSIIDHVQELAADLVVLAAHGRGGIRGWLFGRIAQQVVRRGSLPVCLVPVAATGGERRFVGRTISVALNGMPAAEASLPAAMGLARAFRATIHLICAVPTVETLDAERAASAMLTPNAARAVLELEAADAWRYLAEVAVNLSAAGLASSFAVVRGDPASAIIAEAERVRADILAMATHGRGGLGGLWAGSVGAKVQSRFLRPMLLVPAPK